MKRPTAKVRKSTAYAGDTVVEAVFPDGRSLRIVLSARDSEAPYVECLADDGIEIVVSSASSGNVVSRVKTGGES